MKSMAKNQFSIEKSETTEKMPLIPWKQIHRKRFLRKVTYFVESTAVFYGIHGKFDDFLWNL